MVVLDHEVPAIPKPERQYAMWIHLTTACASAIPIGHFVAAIVLWQIKKQESEFIDDHGKEVVNFQISLFVYALLGLILTPLLGLGVLVWIAVMIISVISLIRGAIAAQKGLAYRYPVCLRFIK
jgi:uncharacterized Tic20 family protein